jgi:hypothetical protein
MIGTFPSISCLIPSSHNLIRSTRAPRNYWKDKANQLRLMKSIEQKLQINHPNDWYTKTVKDVQQNGGFTLLKYHNNSLYNALQALYPEHNWKAWGFQKVPQSYWRNKDNIREYLDSLAQVKDDNSLEDIMKRYEASLQANKRGSIMQTFGNKPLFALVSR